AAIYYNEVIRQQPGSSESEQAKKRIDQLRAKVGDAALQPAFVAAEKKKKKGESGEGSGRTAKGGPPMRGSATDVAPLPPPETDLSLPPPASLSTDTTTAPAQPP